MSALSPCAGGSASCLPTAALRAPLLGAAIALALVAGGATFAAMLPAENTHFPPERLAEVQAMLGR
ncbi:hypothetical protein JQC91_11380 [Jannaschia sp. Os4]|uniref:hypothetical protein n=1 Tax=Jannaschia sp. Os4 TaxID=2807617 RepID=UPI00193A8D57|nr:hypothetical protein [Jannaschia sp. Os4]MBM2576901.1 hypothetical protein [Jannaschia sp. Os4]